MKKLLKVLVNKATVRLFGREAFPKVKMPIRPNRKVSTVNPEGWPLTHETIGTNWYNLLNKKS